MTNNEKKASVVKKIMEINDLEIGDRFNVDGFYDSPYHFDKNYDLIDRHGNFVFDYELYYNLIVNGESIKKRYVREVTIEELEKELGYCIKVVKR